MVAHHRGAPKRPARHSQTPDGSDLQAVRSFVSRSSGRPTAVDLFCGAGGLSLGLERAGFDVLVGADSDEWAVRTHDANLSGLSWCGDLSDPTEFLTTLGVWGVDHVDLLAGGVPCQPFSRAGSSRIRDLVDTGERSAHDHRADLWSSFVTVVEALRPAAVLVENVPDLARWNDGAVLMGLHDSFGALGYRVEARILDGCLPYHGGLAASGSVPTAKLPGKNPALKRVLVLASYAHERQMAAVGGELCPQSALGTDGRCFLQLARRRPKRGYSATKDQLQARLRRIEGQVRGVQGTVAEERYCIDVLTRSRRSKACSTRSRSDCSTITPIPA